MALHHYLPQDRLRALAEQRSLPAHVQGAALFADISGFTALTESLAHQHGERRGVEALTQTVCKVYDALITEVERFGGSTLSFAGDATLCWFEMCIRDRCLQRRAGLRSPPPSSRPLQHPRAPRRPRP